MRKTLWLFFGLPALILSGATSEAFAQDTYPSRRILVYQPYPAGGIVDIATRIIAEEVSKTLGQPIVVEAKPGANTNLATDLAARAEPDGYTWSYIGPATMANPHIYPNLKWSEKSFQPMGMMALAPLAMVVSPSHPSNTLADFVTLAQKSSEPQTYANVGVGSAVHLNAAMLMVRTNIKMTMVPYGGQPPALTDLITDRINFMVASVGLVSGHYEAKKLKVLAVISDKRQANMPEIPTLAEAGYPDINVVPWYGLAAPKGTPAAIVKKVNDAINAAVTKPEIKALMAKQGLQAAEPLTPEQFAARIEKDSQQIKRVIEAANIKINP